MIAKLMCTIALATSIGVLGCADDESDDNGMSSYGGSGGTTATGAATVAVTLQEYEVTLSPTSAAAGEITFSIENTGADAHEFVVVMTDLAPADLPVGTDGEFDEEGEGVEVIDKVALIAPGTTEGLTISLEAGSYVLLCNFVVPEGDELESHFHEGMHAPFTVE